MSNSTGTTTVLPLAPLFQSSKHPAPFPHLKVCPHRLHQFLCPHATNSRLFCYLTSLRPNGWHRLQIVDSVTAVRWKTYVLQSEVPGSNCCIRIHRVKPLPPGENPIAVNKYYYYYYYYYYYIDVLWVIT